MLRAVAAVLVGYITVGVLIFATDQLFGLIIPNMQSMHELPVYYFVISIVTDTAYSALGGWVCAAIGKSHARMSVLFLMALGEVAGLAATIWNWGVVPHYFSFALMILYPPAIWLGGQLQRQRKNRSLAAGAA